MKELSIEEKAKAYDGLIERLKDLKFAYRFSSLSDTIEEIFPELKEIEDEKIRKSLINLVNQSKEILDANNMSRMIYWLDHQKPVEWSEEDEQTFIESVEALEDFGKFELADWLKEHKNKSLRHQSRWKPDSSMLISLEYAIKHINKDGDKRILLKLLEQLKKLREE